MKAFSLILGCLLAFTFARAADLPLSDGRVFRDAAIMSHTPLTAVIKHAQGLTSVSKKLLPPDLLSLYPTDEAAAHKLELLAADARVKADAFHKAEAERSARIRVEREAAETQRAQLASQEAAQRETDLAATTRAAADLANANDGYTPHRRSYYYPYSPFAISSPYDSYSRDHRSSDNRFDRHRDSYGSERNHRRPDPDCEEPSKPKSTHFDRLTDRPVTKSLERDHQQRLNDLESEHARQRHSVISGTATRGTESTRQPRQDTGANVSATGRR